MQAKLSIALTTLLLTLASTALGKPEFVEPLEEATGAPCLPQCNICHASLSGGGEPVQPFVESLERFGEIEGEDAIKAAVALLEQQGVDSDGDGVGDIEEIRAGQDPNYAGDALICQPDVGCGAHIAPRPSTALWQRGALLGPLVLLLGWRLVGRRRKGRS